MRQVDINRCREIIRCYNNIFHGDGKSISLTLTGDVNTFDICIDYDIFGKRFVCSVETLEENSSLVRIGMSEEIKSELGIVGDVCMVCDTSLMPIIMNMIEDVFERRI